MKFRKLYWVVEQMLDSQSTMVTGVYTSIPDLIDSGLRWVDGLTGTAGLRVSLVQLDSKAMPLGCWASPNFEGMAADRAHFVKSDEFSPQECDHLVAELTKFSGQVIL